MFLRLVRVPAFLIFQEKPSFSVPSFLELGQGVKIEEVEKASSKALLAVLRDLWRIDPKGMRRRLTAGPGAVVMLSVTVRGDIEKTVADVRRRHAPLRSVHALGR